MFWMCGHWSGGVYLLGLVMPEASLSVLLARALEARAVDCDKERRENEWNLLIWNVVSIRKEILHYSQFSATVMEYEQTYNKVCTKPQFRVTLWNNKHSQWQVWLCSLPLFFKNGKLSGKVCSLARVCQCFLLMAKSKMTHSSGFTFPHEEHLLPVAFWKDGPNGKALLHILHEAKIIYSCYLEKQSKPTVWKTAIIVRPQREKARLFFFFVN